MAKKVDQGSGRRRPSENNRSVVRSAKRGGPSKNLWLALGAIAIIGVGVLGWQASKPKVTSTAIDPNLPKLKAEGYVLGNADAPVEVIEFADFECPACGRFATLTEPDVRERLVKTGKIRIRFMDFPLSMHKNTWDASLAAACAHEQGKFWEMHDALFANQDRWNGEVTNRPRGPIGELAKSVSLDMTKYESCMDTEKYRAQIQATLAEGERRGVAQTPWFIIGDKQFPGGLPYDEFKKVVDEATLAAASARPAAAAASATDTAKKTK